MTTCNYSISLGLVIAGNVLRLERLEIDGAHKKKSLKNFQEKVRDIYFA
jgi:hypothetical protein